MKKMLLARKRVVTARMIHVRRIRYRLEYGHDERSTVPISAIPP